MQIFGTKVEFYFPLDNINNTENEVRSKNKIFMAKSTSKV